MAHPNLRLQTSNCSLLLVYLPRKDERLSWPGWLVIMCAIVCVCVQAVEYFVEWALSPTNAVFLRVQTGVYDPSLVGDKSKWFSHLLANNLFAVYDESSTLAAALDMQASSAPADNYTGMFHIKNRDVTEPAKRWMRIL